MKQHVQLISRAFGLLVLAVSVAAGTMGLKADPAVAQTYKMKLAIAVANDPLHEFIRQYKKVVEAKSGGRIKAELYPSAQLGNIKRMIEGTQLGTIELVGTPPGFLKGLDPRFQAIEVPGLFDDPEHAHKTITDPDFRTPFLNIGTKKGVKGVSFWMYGPTSYATLQPVRSLDDFKGRKFRVLATKVETEVMKKLGAAGVPMPFSEVLPALQRKLLDGVRSNIVVMGATKFFTVAKNITVVNDTYIPCVGFVSTAFLKKLPADLRKAVEDAGRDVESHMFTFSVNEHKKAEALWRKNGAEVIYQSKKDRQEFVKRVNVVGDELLGTNATVKPLYDILKKTAAKHKSS